MFVVQGDSKAPVTGCNLVKKIGDHVNAASTLEGILFWTPQQLSVTNAVHLHYVFLDAFYSTGKSFTLQFICNHWSNEIGKLFEIHLVIWFSYDYSHDWLFAAPAQLWRLTDEKKIENQKGQETYKDQTWNLPDVDIDGKVLRHMKERIVLTPKLF